MNLPSRFLEKAVDQMATLPGIGRRTAMRLVIDLMKRDKEEVKRFAEAFIEMAEGIQNCKVCGNLSDHPICAICEDERRDSSILCVVEDIRDILAIEATQSFKGKYHVLGGIISPMDGIGPSDLNIPSLLERVNEGSIKEVIFALSATMEGDTTNFYLFRKLKDSPIFISSLSRGVAVGAELQYADEITLSRSILNRQPFTV
jgi:recombination protein RecR